MDDLLMAMMAGRAAAGKQGRVKRDDALSVLKVATAAPSAVSTDRRIEILDEALYVMKKRSENVLKQFDGEDGLQKSIDDVVKWRDALKQLIRCETTEQLCAVMAEHWDSTSLLKVCSPNRFHSGSRARKAFKHAWMRQMFHLEQLHIAEDRDKKASRATDCTPADPPAATQSDDMEEALD